MPDVASVPSNFCTQERIFPRSSLDGTVEYNSLHFDIFLQSWYPETFSPFDDNSHLGASDMKRIVKLQTLADTGMQVIDRVDKRLKTIKENELEKLGRWGFLESMDDTPYQIFTSNPDLRNVDIVLYLKIEISENSHFSLNMRKRSQFGRTLFFCNDQCS